MEGRLMGTIKHDGQLPGQEFTKDWVQEVLSFLSPCCWCLRQAVWLDRPSNIQWILTKRTHGFLQHSPLYSWTLQSQGDFLFLYSREHRVVKERLALETPSPPLPPAVPFSSPLSDGGGRRRICKFLEKTTPTINFYFPQQPPTAAAILGGRSGELHLPECSAPRRHLAPPARGSVRADTTDGKLRHGLVPGFCLYRRARGALNQHRRGLQER